MNRQILRVPLCTSRGGPVPQTRPHGALVQLPAAVVLLIAAAGLVLSATGSWRTGPVVLALALGLAAALRLLLPTSVAGWLVVRSRPFDVAFLLGLAVALVALTSAIPVP